VTFWPNDVDSDNLHRLGPFIDGFVGTDGKYSDLYEAVNTGGWSRIILAAGATLSADLTLSASNGFIWSPFGPGALSLGGKKITVVGDNWKLQGFKISSPTAIGIEIQGALATLLDITVTGAGSHGVYFNTSDNHHVCDRLRVTACAGDGIHVISGCSSVRIYSSFCWSNTGYGVNDQDDSTILVGNYLAGNTAGALNGTPAIDVGNKKT